MAFQLAQISQRKYFVIQKELSRLQGHDWWGIKPPGKVFDKTKLLVILKLWRHGLLGCAHQAPCIVNERESAALSEWYHMHPNHFPAFLSFFSLKFSLLSLAVFGAMWLVTLASAINVMGLCLREICHHVKLGLNICTPSWAF